MNRIKTIWKNRKQIWEGFYNTYLNFSERNKIKKISKKRIEICRSNKCGLYDKYGESQMAFIPGSESCGGCGCLLKEKTSCLTCSCFLETLGQVPMWEPEN